MTTVDKIVEGAITEIEFYPGYPFMIDRLTDGVSGVFRQPHRHRFHEMIWVQEGQGVHSIDFVAYPLTPGRIYPITPGQIHQWHENDVRGYVIQFADSLLDKVYRELVLPSTHLFITDGSEPYVALSEGSTATLSQLAALMLEECDRESPDWNMVRPLLSAFLYELSRTGCRKRANLGRPHHERLDKLKALIELNYMSQASVEFYAASLHITGKRLNEITRELVGKTVVQMVHDRITLEAKRELSLSQDSVKTIAHRLGFKDPSYFGRFFRREAGMAPRTFRHDMQDRLDRRVSSCS